ncbi:redoxin domain-containing protein, partial [Aquimarina celericrescens]|nr:redoxin domain-containing protein [Aquimarina celericrescens]
PQDSPKEMWKTAQKNNSTFPYLFDENQEIAKAYDAACTPDFYLFDTDLKLIYRGQLDDSRPGNGIPGNGRDLRQALDTVLRNRKVS